MKPGSATGGINSEIAVGILKQHGYTEGINTFTQSAHLLLECFFRRKFLGQISGWERQEFKLDENFRANV
jgi:rhodanese-related sulfurtransferase